MGLESANYISQLVVSNPTASDNVSAGDDHLRLLKAVLKNQFTSLGAAAVTATAAQLNQTYGTATAVGTLTGCTTAPTVTIQFRNYGPLVICVIPGIAATSNSTACTFTLTPPAGFWPASFITIPIIVENNGLAVASAVQLGNANLFTLLSTPNSSSGFTASGSKGLPYNAALAWIQDF